MHESEWWPWRTWRLPGPVDQQGAFPERALNALSAAGLMGAVSAPEVGGLDLGFRGAAAIVRRIAQDCGSTAMVTCMHYCGAAVLEAFGPRDVRQACHRARFGHQALGGDSPLSRADDRYSTGTVIAVPHLGGLHHSDRRAA